jgi:DNA-directed RNA polymerase subunit beta
MIKEIIRKRHNFGKIETPIKIPNLIEVQKKSYHRFLQIHIPPEKKEDIGLQSVFKSVFPISDFRDNCTLEFVSYSIGTWECSCGKQKGENNLAVKCIQCGELLIPEILNDPLLHCTKCGTLNKNMAAVCDYCGKPVQLKTKYDIEKCEEKGMTYEVPLKVKVRLILWEKGNKKESKKIKDIKEQEVYFGDIPLMTDNGTFVVNGTEKVIVSQLHRSPGVFFHSGAHNVAHYVQFIPYRGSWLEYEYDNKDILYARVDRKRRILGTVFLRAIGLSSTEDILRKFYNPEKVLVKENGIYIKLDDKYIGGQVAEDIVDKKSKEVLLAAGRKISRKAYTTFKASGIEGIVVSADSFNGAHLIADVVSRESGEVLAEANEKVSSQIWQMFKENSIEEFEVFFPEFEEIGSVISATLKKDPLESTNSALIEMYRRMRPGDPPTLESAKNLVNGMFFNPQRYDLSKVGRHKINTKLNLDTPLDEQVLQLNDVIEAIKYLLKLKKGVGAVDDIDHLSNRRVRSVGELLENQFRIGLVRMERAVREKMTILQDISNAMPHDVINPKPVIASVREFFGSSQLCQFMDQTNPLSEITHKRRLSALGPGGLSRERAGFEVRDVHPSHYGRICPIETPEGPNIGLISSLSCYAKINDFGFIESPYRKVKDGKIIDFCKILDPGDTDFKINQIVEQQEVESENQKISKSKGKLASWEPYPFYMSAWEEDKHIIAQANASIDEEKRLILPRINARSHGDFVLAERKKIDFIDISPKQLVSVAASLIPFLENDDANRALMGSNMQRQAVPLLRPEAPFVGTGMEAITAHDSGAVVIGRRAGIVDKVDSQRIIIRALEEGRGDEPTKADIYSLTKFKRSNQNTCFNQRPLVREGNLVKKGDIIADGPATDRGELALGRNILAVFIPWRGYNFEDAILVSEKLVRDDSYTSIHIEEFEIEARDTKLGPEEITRDIPNINEEFLKQLDDNGIIKIGSRVKPGDILVGKVTPKGETQPTPEEKLLRAIFGEKAREVRDASLVTPPGIEGIVVDVKIFSRRGVEKDERTLTIEQEQITRWKRNVEDEIRIIEDEETRSIAQLLEGYTLKADLWDEGKENKLLEKKTALTKEILSSLTSEDIRRIKVGGDIKIKIKDIEDKTKRQKEVLEEQFQQKVIELQRGDDLPPGVIKMAKIYVAMKRKLSVGDKMAGRHGNKGVIARILPEEDMPFLPDGKPVEIVLNPLGVPSRMNVGQILETHLGWAAKALGLYFSTPVFDGAQEQDIKEMLNEAGLPENGKSLLYDGLTGEAFDNKVTVGYIYMMKLHHLVDDKIHARSTGPYSLITQQPLGGKAQFGGQRFGEMEVWALEAYGAAYTLQELLTAKSDDVQGRSKIYEAIVKGETALEPGMPESFNVLVKELQSLCLKIDLLKESEISSEIDEYKVRRDA